jgi:hypothetical protein
VDSSIFGEGGLGDEYTKLIDDSLKHLEHTPGLSKLLKAHVEGGSAKVVPLEQMFADVRTNRF